MPFLASAAGPGARGRPLVPSSSAGEAEAQGPGPEAEPGSPPPALPSAAEQGGGMAEAGAGADQGPPMAGEAGALAPGDPDWRDWAGGLPDEVLAKIAETFVARTEAGWAAYLKEDGCTEVYIQEQMAERKRDGNCLFVVAMVCKPWRKAQLKVGGPLRTRVASDVILPGSVALAKWALLEGCPRDDGYGFSMARAAAQYGHEELVRWLIQEQGFAMDSFVMRRAARSGNLELVRWLRGEGCGWTTETCMHAAECGRLGVLQWLRANGCPWDYMTCHYAVDQGRVEVLRWARENGGEWCAETRDYAAEKLGYTDDLGNLVDWDGNPVQ